jgi:hypothetical protein
LIQFLPQAQLENEWLSKNKIKYHIVWTVPKSNSKNIERGNIYTLNTDLPLKDWIKTDQACKSALASQFNFTKYNGLVIFLVKSMSRRKQGFPGRTNRHAKLSNPIKDCNSLNLRFFLCLADASTLLTLSIFSCGSRHSILQESTLIPYMVITVVGWTVFSRLDRNP